MGNIIEASKKPATYSFIQVCYLKFFNLVQIYSQLKIHSLRSRWQNACCLDGLN